MRGLEKAPVPVKNGFSLIELMIAVAIVGILASIAIPSYMAYVHNADRTDATKTMSYDAQALERCYSQYFTYNLEVNGTAIPCSIAAGATASPQGYYTITVAIVNPAPAAGIAASYTITAVPVKNPQLSDSACQKFQIDNTGLQQAWNSGAVLNTQPCWGSS